MIGVIPTPPAMNSDLRGTVVIVSPHPSAIRYEPVGTSQTITIREFA